jgi:release factor glutamine methyltransferase
MNIEGALSWAKNHFKSRKLYFPEIDGEVILAYVLERDRAFLFTHPKQRISQQKFARYKKLIQRRSKREPVAYITQNKYFYKLAFEVNKKTLIPRPESEMLVDLGLQYLNKMNKKRITVIDVGTGSGAIMTALAKNFKKGKFIGTDKYSSVLSIARKNCKANKARVEFIKSDLLKKFTPNFWQKNPDVLMIANLPYLPTAIWEAAMPDVKKYEPRSALEAGIDGLDCYIQLIEELRYILPHLKSFQTFWEIHPGQEIELKKLLKSIKAKKFKTYEDLCGRVRVVGWRK